jgi:hypothetical protein
MNSKTGPGESGAALAPRAAGAPESKADWGAAKAGFGRTT